MSALSQLWPVAMFFAVVLLLEGLYLVWNGYRGPEAQRVDRRLRALYAGGEQIERLPQLRKRVLSGFAPFERLLLQVPRIHALDRFLIQSGLALTVARYLGWCFGLAFAAGMILAVLRFPGYVCALAAAAAVAVFTGYIGYRRANRLAVIDGQLPDALDLMARAMQAGHAFSSALRLVGSEGMQPIAGEFQEAFDEINFGMSTDQALSNLAVRVASRDLRYFVVAVLIQRETGGNLSALLESIALLIRERHKLKGTVRVLSAEGRLSAWILGVLPFVLAGALLLINPQLVSRLWTDPIGVRFVAGALALLVVGVLWMWRLVRIPL